MKDGSVGAYTTCTVVLFVRPEVEDEKMIGMAVLAKAGGNFDGLVRDRGVAARSVQLLYVRTCGPERQEQDAELTRPYQA
jgi:hypothetical protein